MFIAAVSACAVAWSAAVALQGAPGDWQAVLLVAVLGMVAERLDINLYGDSRVSISALFLLTAAIALGPQSVLVVAGAMGLAGHIHRGRPLYKLVFNTSVFVLSGLAGADLYRLLVGVSPYEARPVQAVAAIGAALANFAVSSALVTIVVAATAGGDARAIWREKFAWLTPHFAVLGFLAFVLTLAYRGFGAYGMLGFVAPALMMRLTIKQYVDRTERTVSELHEKNREIEALSSELEEAYAETLAAFVSALDMRDTETHGHSHRVAELSLEIARLMGIEPGSREWLDLKLGALLHDVGKIGVPDAILQKQGPLTEEEWAAIRQHPTQGYNMLRGVRFLERAAEMVLSHHERYDGRGYPRGLQAEEISLAARIFAVADTFDAITSERPYKPAYSGAEACREISAHSGTQFDPRVVAVLLHLKGRRTQAA